MATPVWTYPIARFEVSKMHDLVRSDLGDGYYVTGLKSQAWSHQDGTGGSDTSHRGFSIFRVTSPVFKFGSAFTNPLDFLQARMDAGVQTFRLWDPLVEPDTTQWVDGTGPGMHLVKWFGGLKWSADTYQLARFATFEFHEVHS